jgi:hypothetical protein
VGARFSAPVQTCREAHPASYTLGTGSFPGVKWPGRGVDHQPHLEPRLKKSRAIPLLALWAFVASYRVNFTSMLIGEISGSRAVVSEDSSLLRRDVLSLRAVSDVSNEMLFIIDLFILEDESTTFLGYVRNRSAGHSDSYPRHLNPQ